MMFTVQFIFHIYAHREYHKQRSQWILLFYLIQIPENEKNKQNIFICIVYATEFIVAKI